MLAKDLHDKLRSMGERIPWKAEEEEETKELSGGRTTTLFTIKKGTLDEDISEIKDSLMHS